MSGIIAAIFSWFIFILGLSYLLQAQYWIRLSEFAIDKPHRYFPMLLFILLLGLVIVLGHNVWVRDWPVVITIFGWILVSKAVLYLIATSAMCKLASIMMQGPIITLMRGTGILLTVLGGILIYQTGLARFY